ncbi:exodeoxyribonuclease I [Oceanospirillum sediminis]|uniref:Exodeoxyribonuclease I n=1 Tax=Oceanospirillum sediminis TaxID=2760088 RepID=A0A839IPM2_9GAMM|nr:exodeoxyribonuclease I [Oceanospirillum sediminis]MBB1487205.1 exodeoxyribonuclease I [Oceanospirillum sediminis]
MSSQPTFFWHDYESFGADPRKDRPAQFAGIRTDLELNEIGEPVEFFCTPADDFLPSPDACLITGITPQHAQQNGFPEAEFIRLIHHELSKPGTCALGYNTLRFDDELTRHTLYRNFYDAYAREWQNGNSRWDLIDVVRTAYALRPQGIEWPVNEEGLPSFKLELLTAANGIEHAGAHDAVADVRATIALARLLRSCQPKLFNYLFTLRDKRKVADQLDIVSKRPVLHVSGMFGAARGNAAIVVPLAQHPSNKNGVICFDLSADPSILAELSADEIRRRVFTAQDELDVSRIPLKVIHLNRCPIVLPVSMLDADVETRTGINRQLCEQHWHNLQVVPDLTAKLQQVFDDRYSDRPVEYDPDLMLYSGGFFSPQDKEQMEVVRQTAPENLAGLNLAFKDARLEEMLFRYRARSYPEYLSGEEQQRWDEYRWQRINDPSASNMTPQQFNQRLVELSQTELSPKHRIILEDLVLYVESLVPSHLF